MLVLCVLLLTVISVFNVFLEKLLPIEVDIVVGFMLLTGFIVKFAITKPAWKHSILDLPVLILIAAGLSTLAIMVFRGSDYVCETADQFISLIMIMSMSLLIDQTLRNFRSIHLVVQVFTLTVAAMALLGIFFPLFDIQKVHTGGVEITVARRWGGVGVRIGSVYEQPNIFATPLILALPVGVAFTLVERSRLKRLLWMGVVVVVTVGLLSSQSRSGILGAFLGLLAMGLVLWRRGRLTALIRYTFFVAIIVYAVLGTTGILNSILERLSPTYQFYQLEMTGPEHNRLIIWQKAIALAFQNPFGYGAETKYLIGESFGIEWKTVHNVFLGYLTSFGWLGFIGIVLLALRPVRGLWRFIHKSDNPELKVIGAGLLAALLGLWVHNLFHAYIHWAAVWVYLACVASIISFRGAVS